MLSLASRLIERAHDRLADDAGVTHLDVTVEECTKAGAAVGDLLAAHSTAGSGPA